MTNTRRKEIRGAQGSMVVQQPSKRANMMAAEENFNTKEPAGEPSLTEIKEVLMAIQIMGWWHENTKISNELVDLRNMVKK